MMYYDLENDVFKWKDAANRILSGTPSLAGKIGYIIETENDELYGIINKIEITIEQKADGNVNEQSATKAPTPAPAQPAAYSAPVPPMPQAPPNAYNPQFQQNVPPSFAYGNEPYIPDEGIAAMFFRYDNRLNRKRYILRGLVLVGIYIAVAMVAGLLGMLIDQEVASLLIMLVGLAIMVPSYMLLIRRLHDLDRPGWWSIGALIPAVNFALAIYALCCQGTVGPNQYGPDPLQ